MTEPDGLQLLLSWLSPAFPTGAFAYSHGLETAIIEGAVTDADTLRQWVSDLLCHGSGWNDAIIFARCWSDDSANLSDLARALAASRERAAETLGLGRAFLIAAAVWTGERGDAPCPYPVAAGRTMARMGVDRNAATIAFLQGFATALISVAVRLVPLGQTAGLAVLRDLMPLIRDVAGRALAAELSDLGGIAIGSDIAAMRHETFSTRIFIT